MDPNRPQRRWSKVVLGIDPKKIPPYHDATMQARIDHIGASLIPAYQRSLPDSDLTKIIFRFQLIDSKKYSDAVSLPSGIVLVPKQVVEKMQNDSQLAAVLADNIASVLIKQCYRSIQDEEKMAVALLAGDVAGAFIPGVVLGPLIGNNVAAHKIAQNEEEQNDRMSLALMADANYKIDQAPLAWSLLATKNPNDLPEIPDIEIPSRAKYLYRILGTTWRSGQEAPSGSRLGQGAN